MSRPPTPQTLQRFQQTQISYPTRSPVAGGGGTLSGTEGQCANFQELQAQLEGTENRIAVERRKFNETVQTYNTAVQTMPTALFAGLLGFSPRPYFTAREGAETAPQVDFNFGGSPSSHANAGHESIALPTCRSSKG